MRLMCGHCGHTNPESATFCERCDEYLDWSARRVPDEAPAPVQSPPPPVPPRPTAGAGAPTAPVPPVHATASQPPVGSGAPVAVAPAAAAGTTCPACAVHNPPERRFCRHCGAWLVEPVPVPAAPYAPWYRSWWRRLVGPRDRAERAAYRRSLSPVTRAFRIGLAVLAVLLVAVLVSPLVNPVGWLRDTVASARGSGRVDHTQVRAAPLPAPAEGTDQEKAAAARSREQAEQATDDVRGTMWTTPWPGAQAPGAEQPLPECGQPVGGRPAIGLRLTLSRPTDVREIGIEAGAPESFGLAGPAPETVDLLWTRDDAAENGGRATTECQRVTLAATPDLQRFRVTQGRVRAVQLLVVTARPAADDPDADRLRIGEVTFWER